VVAKESPPGRKRRPGKKMKEGECQREEIREYLGEPSRAARQAEIMNMSLEDFEGELAASGWVAKPGDNRPVSEEELMVGIEETAFAMDVNLRRRVKHMGTLTSQAITEVRKKRAS
jgi:hypothetical protein